MSPTTYLGPQVTRPLRLARCRTIRIRQHPLGTDFLWDSPSQVSTRRALHRSRTQMASRPCSSALRSWKGATRCTRARLRLTWTHRVECHLPAASFNIAVDMTSSHSRRSSWSSSWPHMAWCPTADARSKVASRGLDKSCITPLLSSKASRFPERQAPT